MEWIDSGTDELCFVFRSVAMSLRLIPKLIQSFTHFRGGMDVQDVVMYVEKTHNMMQLFFENLKKYTTDAKAGKEYPYFNHLSQIQIRLHFLSVIYSAPVSPMSFQLELAHVNTLWECMASDPIAQDDLFSWLIMQLYSKDQHALNLEGFKLIYTQKLSTLQPESITMLGLNLFSQLCQKSKIICSGEWVDNVLL